MFCHLATVGSCTACRGNLPEPTTVLPPPLLLLAKAVLGPVWGLVGRESLTFSCICAVGGGKLRGEGGDII